MLCIVYTQTSQISRCNMGIDALLRCMRDASLVKVKYTIAVILYTGYMHMDFLMTGHVVRCLDALIEMHSVTGKALDWWTSPVIGNVPCDVIAH